MHHFFRASPVRAYNQFFASRSPVTRIQFWGFILLGGALIVGGLALLTLFVSGVSGESVDALEVVLMSIPVSMCIAVICVGILHIRRAVVGRHSEMKRRGEN
jgi:hypothetical protein